MSFDENEMNSESSDNELDPIENKKINKHIAVFPKRKRGRGARPLLESEIKEAQNRALSAMEAARILNVSYNTYKKYAELYGIFDDLKNQIGIGIPKGFANNIMVAKLDDILAGKHPSYPVWKLKNRLISEGYLLEKCNNCGFEERRVTDGKVPLVLDFIDDDRTNYTYDNLRFLCFNCAYLIRGNLTGPRKSYESPEDIDLASL